MLRRSGPARVDPQPGQTIGGRYTIVRLIARGGSDRMGSKPADYQARLAARFVEMAKAEPGRWRIVYADAPAEQVTAAILGGLAEWL